MGELTNGMDTADFLDETVFPGRWPIRTITLVEHFAFAAFMDGPGEFSWGIGRSLGNPDLVDQLLDIGDRRIADMDTSQIDVQILTLTAPGVEQLEPGDAASLACEANVILAEAIWRHPSRFAGFAAIPTPDPEAAAGYLERNDPGAEVRWTFTTAETRLNSAEFTPEF